jgi:hypothetical protein
MTTSTSELAVRRHERYGCDLPAQIAVAAPCGEKVRLSRSTAGSTGRVSARVVDCSLGGIGLQSAVFFPMSCQVRVWITLPEGPGPIQADLRIQRVVMLDRKPTYYLGGAFESPAPEQDKSIQALMAYLRKSGAPLVPEKPRA